MRILLYDLATGGHRVGHASYIIRHLQERGDQVRFVTPRIDAYVRRRLVEDLACDVHALEPGPGTVSLAHGVLRQPRRVALARRVFAMADDWRADIVHAPCLDDTLPALYLAGLGRRAAPRWRLVGTLFWPTFLDPRSPATVRQRVTRPLRRRFLGRLLVTGRMGGLIVHTDRIRDAMVAAYGPQMRERVFVAPDAALPIERPPASEARAVLELPPDTPVLLCFGGLNREKGLDVLLEALRTVEGEWCAVIAGKPDAATAALLGSARARLPEPERVQLRLGFVDDEDVPHYFAAADAVVLPYRSGHNGTSGVLGLAASAGRPVIATDVGEIGHLVRSYGLGMVIPPDSPLALAAGIRRFLEDRQAIRAEAGPRALRYAEANGAEQMAAGTRAAYEAVLASSRREDR